ncbi:hypothetical protein HOP50_03g20410 [Chloropicon primus]|uniref:Uncharacterized protein n=1 Tax=Chloropicon primus TaxID=1764295 RepID=A0A5B8MGG9_9CHLO|nr:hypothetical protein A3770_03p20410 [Chloropicon primus]UPQ98735.1 hypothetical protein HOP50_03g20410 [Chloropicon primus]|eukprot:QDZ19523.1 hypothetical protein A3770_03p20410 [Chloropicon primus]
MESCLGTLEGLAKGAPLSKKGASLDLPLQESLWDAVAAAKERAAGAEKEEIQQSQRKLEEVCLSFIRVGCGAPIASATAELLIHLYNRGDNIALYSCVGKLQDFLNGKEARNISDAGRASIMRCLGRLVDAFGTQLGSGFQESLTIAQKMYKSQSSVVRGEALLMLSSYVAVCTRDRFACQAQEASLKLAERGSRDKTENVRVAASRLLASVGFAGGQGLYTNGTAGFDEAVRVCLRGIEDPSNKVATAFSDALGQITSCTASTSAANAMKSCKEAKKPQLKQVLDNPSQILCMSFVKSVSEGRGRSCICITLALRKCFQDMKSLYHCGDEKLCFIVVQSLEMLNGLGKVSASVVPLAQACLVYFFHSGPLERLGNVSHVFLLGKLIKLMEKYKGKGTLPFQLGVLQCSRLLVQKLGSVEEEEAESLLKLFLVQLKSKSTHVLQQAVLAISALLFAYPKISESVILSYLEKLTSASSDPKASPSETLGCGLGLAAALSVVSKLELGIPERLIQRSYQFCELVCRAGSSAHASRAGYTILTSLLSIEDALDIPPMDFLKFFDLLKEDKKLVHKRWKSYKPTSLMEEFLCHSSALQTLEGFARNMMKDERMNSEILQHLSQILVQYLSLLLEAPIGGKPSEEFSSTIQQLQLSLIQAFSVLPAQASSSKCKQSFLKLCTVSFQVSDVNVPRSSLLRHLLNDTDSSLGPWHHGYDELEDELQAYEGSLYSPSLAFDKEEVLQKVFHYSLSTETALLDASIGLVRNLFAHLKWKEQKYFLESIVHSMKSSLNVGRSEKKRYHRDTIFTNSACALLGLVGELGKCRFKKENKAAVVNLLLPCAKILLEEGISEREYVRASAEIAAGVCDFGGENIAKSIVKSLCQESLSGCSAESLKGLILWLGAIGRSLGGIALTGLQDSMIKKLQQIVGSGIDETTQIWLLHSYWLIANASGPAFIPYVKQMLTIATQISILSTSHETALLQTVARVGNSVVGILGPEFSPGRFAFQRSNLLIDGTKGSSDDYGSQLEQVLHIQQLLLFAPHVSTMSVLLDTLKRFIKTGQPGVRLAAVTTLRHVAETNPFALAAEGIEHDVIAALDHESEPKIQSLLKRVFCVVMEIGCEENPSKWIQFCQNIVLNESSGAGGMGSDFMDDDEDGEGFGGGDDDNAEATEATGSCLETRAFVMECLCSVFKWVAEDARHWDILKANQSPEGDWMILQLQNLVNSGYKICTGNLPTVRPKGIHLLNLAVGRFGDEEDPDYEGHQLMEQYQAQLLSALRSAFEKSALPTMTTVGLELAANLIEKNILGSDLGTMKRVVSLMCNCLDYLKPGYESHYSEQIIDKLKIGTIESLSRFFCYCLKSGDSDPNKEVNDSLISSLSSEERALVSQGCIDLASDYLAKALMGKDGRKYTYNCKFISSSLMKKSPSFLETARSLSWLSLINAFLLSSDVETIKKNEVFVCSSIEYAFSEIFRKPEGAQEGMDELMSNCLQIVTHLFQTSKKVGHVLTPANCSRVLHILDVLLHKQRLVWSNNIQKMFLECVALVFEGFPSDYLFNMELRNKMCKLACRCVVEFCELGRGMNGAEQAVKSDVAVTCCAKVWEAFLSLSLTSLGAGNVDSFRYCLQNIHFVFNNTTSDSVKKVFAGLLLKAIQEIKKDASPSKAKTASCGLSFALSFVEKAKEKQFPTLYSDSTVIAATLCLSIAQQITKIDFHVGPGGADSSTSTISGFDLTRDFYYQCLEPKSSPKLQYLLLQIWNKDVSQNLSNPEKGWIVSFVTNFAPAVAQAASHAIQSIGKGVEEEAYLNPAVEGLKFFGVCLQAFASEEEKEAVSSLAFPLLYLALTSESTSRTAKALAMAANKLFNLFASKSAASAKAYIQSLPLDKRQLLTKGLQESNAAAQPVAPARGGRLQQPGRIKKPTITLKSFGK